MRALLFVLIAAAAGACTQRTDVVARASDDAGSGAANGDGAPSPPPPSACGPPPASFYVLTKAGDVHTFDIASSKEIAKGAPECLSGGVATMAVDRGGALWIAGNGILAAVDPASFKCMRALKMPSPPLAMAFAFDPKTGAERLYTAASDTLSIVDTSTDLVLEKPIGKLPTSDSLRSIAGTADGWLLAFSGDPVITIALVSTSTGDTKTVTVAKSPDPFLRFGGGFPTGSGFELVVGPNAYGMPLSTNIPALQATLFAEDPGVLAVATSPCAPLGK